MKQSLFLLSVVVFSLSALFGQEDPQGIHFIYNDWEAAKAQAIKESKPIFVDCFTTWCGPCKKLASHTFMDPEVAQYFNETFVNLKMDMEKGEGTTRRKEWQISSYPTLLFFNPDGMHLRTSKGYIPPIDLLLIAKKSTFNILEFEQIEQDYLSAKKNKDEYLSSYLEALLLKNVHDHNLQEEYLKSNKKTLGSVKSKHLIYLGIEDFTSPFFKYFLENKGAYEDYFGKRYTDVQMERSLNANIDAAAEHHNNDLFEQCITLLKSMKTKNKEEKLLYYRSNYYKQTEDWKWYGEAAMEFFKTKTLNDSKMLNNIAWEFYSHIDNSVYLKEALKWSAKSVELKPEYSNTDTYAALLFKNKQYTKARTTAKKALELGEASGQDISGTQSLLEEIERTVKESK